MDDSTLEALRLHRSTLGVDEQGLRTIAARAQFEEVSAGQVLHRSGQKVASLLLVVRGRLRLALPNADGSEQTIRQLGRGAQFGLLGVIQELIPPALLMADEDSQVLRIAREDARHLLQELPLWKRNLIESVGGKQSAAWCDDRQRPQFIALLHASGDSQSLVKTIVQRLEQLGETTLVLSDESENPTGSIRSFQSVLDENRELLAVGEIHRRVAKARDCDRVILNLEVAHAEPLLSLLGETCDRVYWFVMVAEAERMVRLVAKITAADSGLVDRTRWVWCLDQYQAVAPRTPQITGLTGRDFKLRLPKSDQASRRLAAQGVARLLHDMRGVRLAVALSGGAARGMAHLGVFQTLEEAGIVVDAISGTSVGAMVAVTYAAGIQPAEAAEYFARDLTPGLVEQRLPGGDLLYLLRKYRRKEWDEMLRVYVHDWHLQQLLTPVSSVAVDLVAGRQYVQDGGDAVQAILDSINLPGLSPPICRDGMALVDGGILNNVPADVLVNQGADFVIAVDVGSQLPEEFSGIRAGTATEKMAIPNMFDTLLRAMSVQNRRMQAWGAQPADFRIEPDVSAFAPSDFRHAVEIADAGRLATEKVMSELGKQLRNLDPSLMPFTSIREF